MTLRLKLLLALAPLAMALCLVGVVAVHTISSLGRHSERILRENYRSVVAAQRMKDAIEGMQDAAIDRVLIGAPGRSEAQAKSYRQRFEEELRAAQGNITEMGEAEALQRLTDTWEHYRTLFGQFGALSDDGRARQFALEMLRPSFVSVRADIDAILLMNQDAMVHKSEQTKRESGRVNQLMILASLAALLLGGLASGVTTSRLLQPLSLLDRTVSRIEEGDFETRVEVSGSDELAHLAEHINSMAKHLSQYRHSSLGELLLAQQGSQAAIDSLPDPVVIYDAAGRILNVNRAAEELLGLQGAAGDGSTTELESPVQQVLERTRGHVLGGKGVYVPKGFDDAIRITPADGEHYLLPRANPVYSEDGSIAGAAVVLQDVTRLRLVDELRNNVVATVAHEFRTPLTSLRMAIHLMIEQSVGPLTAKQSDLLYAARDDCQRLQSTVDELLDLARIQSGRIELNRRRTAPEVLINTALDACRNSAEQKQLNLESRIMPGLGEVSVDRERMQLVFSNLLNNAIRHTNPGGQITAGARAADGGSVRFEVSDTGEGIPAEFHRSIFDRFVRVSGSEVGGAGLGLSIAKDIVEAHGGEIGIESVPGEGSTFWFILPREGGAIA